LRSLSVKFIVPDKLCKASEPVVFAFSLKLPVALDDVIFGLWLVIRKFPEIKPPLRKSPRKIEINPMTRNMSTLHS
jgi:hypothetical protein